MPLANITLLLAITALVSLLVFKLKQPIIIGYILSGIILGPQVLGWLEATHQLETLSQIGIVLLLFIVGLHLNPQVLKEVGKAATYTGLGQIIFTSAIGMLLTMLAGFSVITSLFVAIAITFSSTIIVMKLISDRGEINKLYAKLSIGFLLVQDLVAVLILVAIPLFASSSQSASLSSLLISIVIATTTILIAGKYLLPQILKVASKSMELLFLLTISWGVGVAVLLQMAGLSIEVGALLAGIMLSTSQFVDEIASRLRPLRDFFLIIFFLLLGSHLDFSHLPDVIIPALLLSVFVLAGNPLIVYLITQFMGYTRKVSFQAGLTVAQISEFSFILMAAAAPLYDIPDEAGVLVTVIGLITIAASTYMITYADQIFDLLEPMLKKISRKHPTKPNDETTNHHHILWFGLDPLQDHLSVIFKRHPHQIELIDYDPEHIDKAKELGLKHRFGDASDTEFLSELNWAAARAVVSLIPDASINHLILQHAISTNPNVTTIVTARTAKEADKLYSQGARYVVLPYHLSAYHIERFLKR